MLFIFIMVFSYFCFFFFKQKTAYEMRISDWSSDVCSSDLLVLPGVVELPQLRPLVLRVPAMVGRAKGEDALLGAALLLVAPSAAERRVETIFVERLLQPFRLPHVGVQRAMIEGVDHARHRLGIVIEEQAHPAFMRHSVAKLVHRPELPRRIHMQQRKGRSEEHTSELQSLMRI